MRQASVTNSERKVVYASWNRLTDSMNQTHTSSMYRMADSDNVQSASCHFLKYLTRKEKRHMIFQVFGRYMDANIHVCMLVSFGMGYDWIQSSQTSKIIDWGGFIFRV